MKCREVELVDNQSIRVVHGRKSDLCKRVESSLKPLAPLWARRNFYYNQGKMPLECVVTTHSINGNTEREVTLLPAE
jgi:hypothetical protein